MSTKDMKPTKNGNSPTLSLSSSHTVRLGKHFPAIVVAMLLSLSFMYCQKEHSDQAISFTSESTSISSNTLHFMQGEVTRDTIELLLYATDIRSDRLYGVAFDIVYDPQILSFEGIRAGSFLEDKGKVTVNYMAAPQSDDNTHLVVGISQQGSMAGVVGDGIVARLTFRGIKAGSSAITFSQNVAKAPDLSTISDITWIGGSIRYTR